MGEAVDKSRVQKLADETAAGGVGSVECIRGCLLCMSCDSESQDKMMLSLSR